MVDIFQTILEIECCKKEFEKNLEEALELVKVQAPLFVTSKSGLQDQLSGNETPVSFTSYNESFEVVQSLAKWKRMALGKYGFKPYQGLYTDMKAVRKDETLDEIHSMFVEQWDWEKTIYKEDRNLDYLKKTVRSIYSALLRTSITINHRFGHKSKLSDEIHFITTQELLDLYPDKDPKEREYLYAKEKGSIFLIGIGPILSHGKPHDLRSPDYDDWDMNGDLLVYDAKYDRVLELSSMGIRVDEDSIIKQLKLNHKEERMSLPYHQMIIQKKLPYSIGGGLGQSRILMLLLERKNIAEVQASAWPSDHYKDADFIVL